MIYCVEFQEMVFAAIAGDFKLGAKADDGAGFFSPRNRFLDVLHIAIEIHCPLIEVAGGYLQKPHFSNYLQFVEEVNYISRERSGRRIYGLDSTCILWCLDVPTSACSFVYIDTYLHIGHRRWIR